MNFYNFNSIKVRLKLILVSSIVRMLLNFNSIKVRLKLEHFSNGYRLGLFQFHKGTIKTLLALFAILAIPYFNSIKVRLKPIVWGYIISLLSIAFANAKLINLIGKMSMGDYIFLCVLRQPLYLLVLQQVKDLNYASERIVCRLEQPHRQLFVTRNCQLTSSLFQVFVCPYYNQFCL